MAAAFIPLVLLLLFGWAMFFALRREAADAQWWVNILQAVRIVPREPEPKTPFVTRTNVLNLDEPDPRTLPPPEPIDYTPSSPGAGRSSSRWAS